MKNIRMTVVMTRVLAMKVVLVTLARRLPSCSSGHKIPRKVSCKMKHVTIRMISSRILAKILSVKRRI